MTIRIYADNACDLDDKILAEYGIRLFHMPVTINDVTYRDRLTISPTEFYQLLEDPAALPTTAQITPVEFQKEFAHVMSETEDEIIYIAFSSGLSGTYQSACVARDMVNPARIKVIDSLSASVGYGLTVLRAARAVKEGKNCDQVITEIEDNIQRIQHIFVVGNFDMLKRGGRVNAATAAIGNLLNIKLILHFVDGKIVPFEKARGLKKARKRMLEIMEQRGGRDLRDQVIGINHSNDLDGALELKEMVEEKFGCTRFVISEIGAAIGSHVGAGTYSVFFLTDTLSVKGEQI